MCLNSLSLSLSLKVSSEELKWIATRSALQKSKQQQQKCVSPKFVAVFPVIRHIYFKWIYISFFLCNYFILFTLAVKIQQRYVLAFMLFLAQVLTVSLRSSIGIILTQMVKIPNLNVTEQGGAALGMILGTTPSPLANEEICPADDIIKDPSSYHVCIEFVWQSN